MTQRHVPGSVPSGRHTSSRCLTALLFAIAQVTLGAQGVTTASDATAVKSILGAPPAPDPALAGGEPPAAPSGLSMTMDAWTPYRTVWFTYNSTTLDSSELKKIEQIALYAAEHPTADVGIGRSNDFGGFETNANAIHTLRLDIVRAALVRAGVADTRIRVDAFDGQPVTLDRRVVVMVRLARRG